jgi:hypothetical protein
MDDLIYKLKTNYIIELNKREIDKFERAEIIQEICKEEKLSLRAFAEKFGFNKSTVEDWLLWTKISREEYAERIKNKETESEIYRFLRNNKTKITSEFCKIDFVIENAVHQLTQKHNTSKYTPEKIKRLEGAIQDFKTKHNLE